MEKVLRSSEFWVALVGLVALSGAKAGIWSQADFDQFVAPALTYISARLVSKFAKSVGTK